MKSSRWLDCRSRFKLLFLFAFIFINVVSAFAGPSVTTYQAKIIKPDGLPLEASSVNFRFTILDPTGGCILYAENYTAVNMTSTSGLISFSLGSGVKSFPASATTFEQVFSNITPTLSCDAGGLPSYSPSANDSRKIVMQFHDGSGWQTLPAMNINAVPYAMFANDSQKLGGVSATSFVQTSMIPSCAASEAVRYNGTSFSCIAVGGAGGGGSVTSGSVITALGYTPADGASVTTLASNLGTTNSNVSSVSSSVSMVATGLFSVSTTVTSLSSSVASLATIVSNHSASLTALASDISTKVTSSAASIEQVLGYVPAASGTLTSSQWATSGTSITYSTGNVGIGVSNPAFKLEVGGDVAVWGPGLDGSSLQKFAMKSNATGGWFEVPKNASGTRLNYSVGWRGGGSPAFYVEGQSMNVGIGGITTPITRLDVSGGLRISMESATCAVSYAGTLRYNGGLVEYCNGSSWAAFGVAGAGLMSLNGLTSGSQTFATGSTGLTANVSSTGTVHTFNIPLAATNGVTGGLVSNADYQYFTNSIASTVTSLTAVANNQVANAVSFATIASQQSTNAASFAAVASSLNTTNANVAAVSSAVSALTSSQWITSATNVGYTTGNVGINTTSPRQNLDIAPAAGNAIVRATSTNAAAALQLYRNAGGGNYYGPVLWSNGTNLNFGHDTSENAGPTLMTLTTGGALGIGTMSPSDILHVVKSTDSRVLVDSVTGSSGLELRTGSVSSAGGGYIDFASSATSHVSPDYDFRLITNTSGLNVMTPGSNARLTVNANGNIGIGATTANRKLHVQYNESGADDGIMIENQGNAGANLSLKSSGAGGREFMWISTGSANSIGAGALGLYDNAAPGYRMVVGSNGNVGIGNNAPTAKLHLGAGTTSFAPLKLTSGALLTSAASGAIEYDGFNYFVTDGTNTRRAIATVANPGTYDNASNISSTGNITMTPTGSVIVSSTTGSTNSQTGALVIKGGLGVATDVNVSGTLNVTGAATFGSNVMGNGNFSTGGGNRGYWMDVPGNFNYGIWRDPSDNVHIRSGGTTNRLTIASSTGWVGIGTNPGSPLHVMGQQALENNTNNAGAASISFWKNRNYSATQSNDEHGYISFFGHDGSTTLRSAYIIANGDGAPTAGSVPGNLRFFTTNGGNNDSTEKLRITSGGAVGIGTTAPPAKLSISNNASAAPAGTVSTGHLVHVLSADGANSRILVEAYTNGTSSTAMYQTRASRGTAASPAPIDAGDSIGAIRFTGNAATAGSYTSFFGAGIDTIVPSAWTAGAAAQPTHMTFSTTGGGSYYSERMRITSTGDIGINTTTPEAKLDIIGTDAWPATSGTSQTSHLRLRGTNHVLDIGSTPAAPWGTWFQAVNRSDTSFNYNILLNPNGGNVGIGLRAPTNALHVSGTSSFSPTTNVSSAIMVGTQTGSAFGGGVLMKDYTYYAGMWTSLSGQALMFGAGGTAAGFTQVNTLAVTASGAVGVGTAAPTEKLEVVGNIKVSGEVYKTTSWGFKKGPAAYVSDYINSWTSGYHAGTSIDCTSSANGCSILKSGTYEIRCVQRATSTSSTFIGIALNGDRTTLEGYANGVWSHDHSISPGGFTESNYMGTLTAGQFISCGPPAANSTTVVYAPSAYNGTLTIKRID